MSHLHYTAPVKETAPVQDRASAKYTTLFNFIPPVDDRAPVEAATPFDENGTPIQYFVPNIDFHPLHTPIQWITIHRLQLPM